MKSSFIVFFLLHSLFVCGIPRPKRLVKRAANLNAGFDIEAFRQDQLDLHNHYRALHNVPAMTKDEALTREAQEYAEDLAAIGILQHCRTTSCNTLGAGENLAYAGGSTTTETNATLEWYKEVYYYNYCEWTSQGGATKRPGHEDESKQVGHFTQIVWVNSTKLGIGYARSSDQKKVYVVGRYLDAGNILGRFQEKVPKATYLLDKYQDNCDGTDGGLSDWSQPSACTKPCGRGIRIETRTCTNPKPSYNGRDCSGETKRISGSYWCNSQACPTTVNERDEQCGKRGYIAESHQFSECALHCKESPTSNVFYHRGQVDDGTLCYNGDTPIGSCFNGQCVLLEIESGNPDNTAAPPSATTTTSPPTTTTNPPPTTTNTPPPTTKTTPPPTTTNTPPPTTTTTLPPTTSAPTTTEAEGSEETTALQGGWSAWSEPGACSKTCGGGISFRTRSCHTPESDGGCEGPDKELHTIWCNPQPCSSPIDERDKQCEDRGYLADSYNFGGADECTLYCRHTNGFYYNRNAVDDGTRCNMGTGACVASECKDMSYEAGIVLQGEFKTTISGSFTNNVVVAVPNGATNVKITHNSFNVRAVSGYRTSSGFSGYTYTTNGVRTVQGVSVTYASSDITIAGPVNPTGGSQIVVYAIPVNGGTQADITYEYSP